MSARPKRRERRREEIARRKAATKARLAEPVQPPPVPPAPRAPQHVGLAARTAGIRRRPLTVREAIRLISLLAR